MKKRQLGKAISILVHQTASEHFAHADIAAFGAPGECHTLVRRNEERRWRLAVRRARAVSGMTRSKFRRVIRQFGPGSPVFDNAVGCVLERDYPFC